MRRSGPKKPQIGYQNYIMGDKYFKKRFYGNLLKHQSFQHNPNRPIHQEQT